ncbi:MAG: nucleotidyltransferase [Proteobacteria bacterium]|nr:nucleotidyltransferase [Pseudomonadota bacterium]
MTNDLERIFARWADAPKQTEKERCENAERAIRSAIQAYDGFDFHDVRVFTQGSYQNRVNVTKDSDVDIGVCCRDVFFFELPNGATREDFGIIEVGFQYSEFKDRVEEALVNHFGRRSVQRGNKAFKIGENTYRIDADVAPFFEYRYFFEDGRHIKGVELYPDDMPDQGVINWPDQHYDNGVRKNQDTGRRFKALVRILKSLRNIMEADGSEAASRLCGFSIECLTYNVPDNFFGHQSYTDDVRTGLQFLFNYTISDDLCLEWTEVSELKYLFRPTQPWTRQQAFDFVTAASNLLRIF